ncbi:MAG: hypothetical protein WKF96_24050 [Solirubrobacteraceae bacterium]
MKVAGGFHYGPGALGRGLREGSGSHPAKRRVEIRGSRADHEQL